MDDFEDRARRAGDALNESVIDLEPASAAPAANRTRRNAGVALVIGALVVGGLALSQRDESRDSLRADVAPTTEASATGSAPAPLSHYLPRWLPPDMVPSNGATGVGCSSAATGQAPATTISLPPGVQVHSGTLVGTVQVRSAVAAAVDGSPCEGPWWTAIYRGASSSTSPRGLFLHGGGTPAVPATAEQITVRGQPASLFALSAASAPSPVPWFGLAWRDDGMSLTLNGIGLTRDELLRIAESVERVSEEEWNAVVKPSQAPSTPPPAMTRPDDGATELARLTRADGQLLRLVVTADGARVCLASGLSLACGPSSFPSTTDARILNLSGDNGMILLPAGLPADLVLRRMSGETVPSARSSDGRWLLAGDLTLGSDYEIVDSAGRLLAPVKGVPCPFATSAGICVPPTTTR
jgi:hypothetical protein